MRLAIVYMVALLFLSCKNTKHENSLFQLVENSGINFDNKVEDDSLENSFLFRNFYNGGGVAIGDINNDGLDEILVLGRETKGLARGPAFQLFDGNGNLLVTQFVLNADFTNLKAFTVDQNGDGDKEIGIGGIETKGLLRGPAYQIFESNGTLVQTRFVLNPDF